MRIRRKKHLDERLNLVKDLLIIPPMDIANVKEAVKQKAYFDFANIFNNDNPVELEIGCGKGGFIVKKAKRFPNVNFIAVELLQNIIVMAAELAQKEGVKNIKFINSGAEYLPRYIREGSISNVYLNFSPPFPKDGYESRRLTSDRYLPSYKSYLRVGGAIYQKTDDKPFFEYSLNKFVEYGFNVENFSDKLNDEEYENIQTEYEKKFVSQGLKVYALKATKI